MPFGGALEALRASSAAWRRQAGTAVVRIGLTAAASAARLHPRADPERHGVEVIRDVAYAADGRVHHRLDVYRPLRRGGPLPVVVYVHGGGFCMLSKDTHWVFALAFARRGYLVFNVSYRLAPAHPYPAALEDCAEALAWVVRHAPELGGDPARLALAGESAGANLVTALAIAACHDRPEPFARRVRELGIVPRAVLPACGLLQVSDPGRFAGSASPFVIDHLNAIARAYLGSEEPGDHGLADPLVVLERGDAPRLPLPPFFAPVGGRDPIAGDTERLARALARLGVPCAAPVYAGESHAFHALAHRPAARRCWQDTLAFLDTALGAGPAAAELAG